MTERHRCRPACLRVTEPDARPGCKSAKPPWILVWHGGSILPGHGTQHGDGGPYQIARREGVLIDEYRRRRKLIGLCPECASPEPAETHECLPEHVTEVLQTIEMGGPMMLTERPQAPAVFGGWQHRPSKRPSIALWTLVEEIPGHPVGSTLSTATLRDLGYEVTEPEPER